MYRPGLAVIALLASLNFFSPARAADTLEPSRATMPGKLSVSLNDQVVDLGLTDAVFLGLRDNRAIRSAFLQRISQRFDLRVAEDQFTPKLLLSGRALMGRNQDDHYRTGELSPSTTMVGELGTQFSLSWTGRVNQSGRSGGYQSNGLTFSVIQPLLRDAGPEVTTAPVRLARLGEQINRLNLKSTVSQTITQIAVAYRELLRAQEQVRIARDALVRSQQLMEVNKALIKAGRMAEFEIVQTEADAATQELGVEEAANNLDASRRGLLRLLAFDLNTQVRASDALGAKRVDLNVTQALRVAMENQPEYLMQLISSKQAAINLVVAKNQRLWDVSLVGGASQLRDRVLGDQSRNLDRQWDKYAGIQVNIPIGDLRPRQNEIRAEIDIKDRAIRLAEMAQLLERDVGDAVRDVGTRWRQYEIAQRAHELSLRKLEIERDKLKVGRSSNFQVVSFETDLRNAENAQLNALIAYLNAQTLLDEKLGMTLETWDIVLND